MMERILKLKNKKALAVMIIGLGLLALFSGRIPLSTVSYYQGIHPSFEAVYYDGDLYTMDEPLDASVCRIHPASFDFDPDEDHKEMPNLRGELRDIQIVRDLGSYEISDVASHILSMGGEAAQPYKVYEWEVEIDDEIHSYRMENWLCSMDVNLWVDPSKGDFWTWFWAEGEIHEKKYSSTEIWLKLEARPDWYFEGADETYFGLGYMELAQLSFLEGHENPSVELMPESRWAAFSIYDSLNGISESVDPPLSQAQSFQGTLLNPSVFRDEWYTLITIDNFGTFDVNFWDTPSSYNTDSVQLKILVHVFVVGEWIAPHEDERDMEEHPSTEVTGWFTGLVDSWNNLWGNNWFKGSLFATTLAIVVIYLFITKGYWKMLKKKGDS